MRFLTRRHDSDGSCARLGAGVSVDWDRLLGRSGGDAFGWTLKERAQNEHTQIPSFQNENREQNELFVTVRSNAVPRDPGLAPPSVFFKHFIFISFYLKMGQVAILATWDNVLWSVLKRSPWETASNQ